MKLGYITGIIASFLLVSISLTFFYQGGGVIPITGRAAAPSGVFVFNTNFIVCNYTIPSGWSMISVPCFSSAKTLDSFMVIVGTNFSSIHWYDSSDPADHWKAYNPGLPGWVVQDLYYIEKEKGYWVDFPSSSHLLYNGTMADSARFNIEQGWNLIGYPNNESLLINDTVDFDYSSVHTYIAENSSDLWKVYYNPPNASNDLQYLDIYRAYWVYSNVGLQWIKTW